MPYDLEHEPDREDRRKHLDIVQAVIARQAASSAATKGWAITLAVAIFGVAVVRSNFYLILLGVLTVVVLSIADSLYLHNETRFRDLYDAIVLNQVEPFSMDLSAVATSRTRNKSYWSWSVAFIYAPVLLGGLVLGIVAAATDDATNEPPVRHHREHCDLHHPEGPDADGDGLGH